MTACYLDASAILPTINRELGSEVVDRFLAGITEKPVISEFASAEVASALSRLVRTRVLTLEDATERLADFDIWRTALATDLDLQPADMRLANVYVRRFDLKLRAPDALHAAICRRASLRLVTMDRRLASAAIELGVHTELLRADA